LARQANARPKLEGRTARVKSTGAVSRTMSCRLSLALLESKRSLSGDEAG